MEVKNVTLNDLKLFKQLWLRNTERIDKLLVVLFTTQLEADLSCSVSRPCWSCTLIRCSNTWTYEGAVWGCCSGDESPETDCHIQRLFLNHWCVASDLACSWTASFSLPGLTPLAANITHTLFTPLCSLSLGGKMVIKNNNVGIGLFAWFFFLFNIDSAAAPELDLPSAAPWSQVAAGGGATLVMRRETSSARGRQERARATRL